MTPQLRFPQFKDNWQQMPLNSVAKIYDGTHQTPTYVKDGVPFYSVEQVTANNFDDTKFISEEVYAREQKRVTISRGDILMTRIGDIGTARYIDWNVRASFYVSLALIKQSDKYVGNFLSKYIDTDIFQRELWQKTIHVAFPKKINLGEIGNCLVKLPSIPEQQKIADFSTAVDEQIATINKKVGLLKKYKKSVMQKIFTQQIRFTDSESGSYPQWESKKLGDIATIKTGDLNVQDAQENGKYTFFDRSEDIKKYNKYSFDNEALIYAGEGSKFLPRYFKGKYGLHQRSYTIFDVYGVNMKLLYYFMLTQNNHFLRYAVGSTVKSLRMDCFTKCIIPVPSIKEQQKIAEFLTAIDEKITLEESKLKAANAWKKGLLQRMFV